MNVLGRRKRTEEERDAAALIRLTEIGGGGVGPREKEHLLSAGLITTEPMALTEAGKAEYKRLKAMVALTVTGHVTAGQFMDLATRNGVMRFSCSKTIGDMRVHAYDVDPDKRVAAGCGVIDRNREIPGDDDTACPGCVRWAYDLILSGQ